MAKSLVLGNGRLHVGLDEYGLVHDLYFPYIGLENHLQPHGFPHKVGVFVDGKVSWLDDPVWHITTHYHRQTMIGETIAINDSLGLRLELTDAVDYKETAFIRSIHVINVRADSRTVKLYCHQGFMISDSASSDTVQYRPDLPGIVHYKGNRVFLASLVGRSGTFDDFTVGQYDTTTNSSTFRDAEDGYLEKNIVDNGRVDSVVGMTLELDAYDSARTDYILVAEETVHEAERVLDEFLKNGVLQYLSRTAVHWREWVLKARISPQLPGKFKQAAWESLIVIAAHLDRRGAIMASLDSSLRNHPQNDTYNFCWGRDSMYILWSLLRLGYTDELISFFDFSVRGLQDDGYLSHKYRADGSLGSTWLPYRHPDGSVHPPIQSDETAAVLFLLGQYHRRINEQAFISRYYETLVEPMANFLSDYTLEDGLPRASYDLWEQTFETTAYTTAMTYAALLEAAELADVYGRSADGARWRAAAEAMQSASSCFYNSEKKYFYKGFLTHEDGTRSYDDLIDVSSLYGTFMFGLFDIDSEEIQAALQTAREQLSNGSLYMRFVGDDLYGHKQSPNLWPIVSLWMAEIALERDELVEAETILNAVLDVASPSGMLPEQVDPGTHILTSLAPLVWSHAELINTLIDYTQTKRPDA